MSRSLSSRQDSRFSCLPAIPRAFIHASHQIRCWSCSDATWCSISSVVGHRPTAIMGLLNLDRFVINACIHILVLNTHHLQKNKVPDEFAAVSLAIGQEGSCEPQPTLAVGRTLLEGAEEAPRPLSRMHPTKLLVAMRLHVLLDVGPLSRYRRHAQSSLATSRWRSCWIFFANVLLQKTMWPPCDSTTATWPLLWTLLALISVLWSSAFLKQICSLDRRKCRHRHTRVACPSQPTFCIQLRWVGLPSCSNDAKSTELARAVCGCSSAAAAAGSLARAAFGFHFASFGLTSSGTRLVFGVCPTLCTEVTFLPILILSLTFASFLAALAVTFLLAFLPVCPEAVQLHRICSVSSQQPSWLRADFSGLQCRLEFIFELARTSPDVLCSWQDAVPTHLERRIRAQLS